ncbi:hypothetical protein [Variibacter gotjawalensis]|uniref:hypothetical protein n=1 Tax=Variibacter gotjawalensis TaxID=1333996 RepID=UPI0012FE381D|nr:hypothetical protein [Variibacter gotjawalensis]NIK48650.1 hypothetical protein [Variibacter gotjawalensis]
MIITYPPELLPAAYEGVEIEVIVLNDASGALLDKPITLPTRIGSRDTMKRLEEDIP